MTMRDDCPGCGNRSLSAPFRLVDQPVVLNYRFTDPAAASGVPRGDVTLRQCHRCSLVFNATFDIRAIPYDGHYENRQCFSTAFHAHLETLARRLTRRNGLTGGRILEIGCGKGDFLRLLCATAGATGEGYDTSYEPSAEPEPAGISFSNHYLLASGVRGDFDAVICRHVVEHVPEIGAFLRELHAIATAAGDPVVVLETPRFEWIVEHLCLWDVFYEHCNYISTAALAYLSRLAGFRVVEHRDAFGAQYQVLELRLDRGPMSGRSPAPGVPESARLGFLAERAQAHLDDLATRVSTARGGRAWGVWGAGAKGVALVNQIAGPGPARVIDSNPAKQGGVLPGTHIPIVAPDDPGVLDLGLVVIANPNYADEIGAFLQARGFTGSTLVL